MITTMDWLIDVLVPAIFTKLDSLYLSGPVGGYVSVLGLTGAMFLIWYCVRRFT